MSNTTGSNYKNESAELVKGSNVVEHRPTGDMDGEGLESTSPKFPKEKGQQEWRDGPGLTPRE